ncbi:hypothetical protein GCM10010492_60560 [Saccharothrix mutabilis subsp. mutabilis]|uniref:Uncharacterized protein n=1 Tax=Saccharothrix mutabilis subsp. mutabilis TaxID=66855 RepID=A0ABN0UIR8_9PSEU
MTVADVLRRCLGDPARFKDLRDRVDILFEEQVGSWTRGAGGWLVLPLDRAPQAFYLLSEDREGQRRGREVLQAFLGPVASITSVSPDPAADHVDRLLEEASLRHISHIRRENGQPGDLLTRIEDAVATVKGKDARLRLISPSYVDLLRDLRLALLNRDGRLAERIFEDIKLTGRLSAENIRFLRVEVLGRLERWRELRDQRNLAQLLRVRRPRVVNEILLEMVWHTEVAGLVNTGRSTREMFYEADLGARYGSLISAVDVPASAGGRAVGVVTAVALGDPERVKRLLLAAEDDVERRRLTALAEGELEVPAASVALRDLFEEGQSGAFIRAFLEAPVADLADLAVQATLDSEDLEHAFDVLTAVNGLEAAAVLRPDRRLLRDIEDLARLVGGSCAGWPEWCERLARDVAWPDAANVARRQCDSWEGLSQLTAEDVRVAADALSSAWDGINGAQVAASLDVLCRAAAAAAGTGAAGEFCDTVLVLLAEQENLSSPVREAYSLLLERILDGGPSGSRYRDAVELTARLWRRAAAASSVDWGIGLVDALLVAPSFDPSLRLSVIAEILRKAQNYHHRLSARQRSELVALGEECGVPVVLPEQQFTETGNAWTKLDGKVVGLYTLLPGAAASLARRLALLCSPGSFESNSDTVGTAALRSLATRADVLVVDTWHASHAATDAIDAVRSRNAQVFPIGRGVSAFLQAIEKAIADGDSDLLIEGAGRGFSRP